MRTIAISHLCLALIAALALGVAAAGQDRSEPTDPIERLERDVADLQVVVQTLREELAKAHLARIEAEEAAAELRQFIDDHHEFGQDFERYQQLRAEKERQTRQLELDERRREYETRKAEREARRAVVMAARKAQKAEADRLTHYRDLGFNPIGLDVFNGKNAYSYPATDTTTGRIDYAYGFGNYLRLYPSIGTDYSKMTISGSILNGAEEIRNIGVAFTFFDDEGNQVGQETVQVANARPDVPYPFTSTLDMALDRPFASSSIYVLYADPVD